VAMNKFMVGKKSHQRKAPKHDRRGSSFAPRRIYGRPHDPHTVATMLDACGPKAGRSSTFATVVGYRSPICWLRYGVPGLPGGAPCGRPRTTLQVSRSGDKARLLAAQKA
jgi:hypothetical protein